MSPARDQVPTSRRPGRPRDARADEVILDAAAAVLGESGAHGFSVDAVAARAGVGKATIYRRWPSRAQLLLETAHMATPDVPDPDTGSVRRDLVLLMAGLLTKMRDTPAGRLMPAVMAEAAVNAEMRELLQRFVEDRRSRAVAAVRRGIDRGELRSDVDVDLVVDLVAGPIFQRLFITGQPVFDALAERTVDAVLDGVAAPA
ncbi:MAG: TetR/AcrR family transcriptional regulator [Acidimicrobiales bacterium]